MARLGTYQEPDVQRLTTSVEREFRNQDTTDLQIQNYIAGPLLTYLNDLAAFVGFTAPPAPPWA